MFSMCSFCFMYTRTTEFFTYRHTLSLPDALPCFNKDRLRVLNLRADASWIDPASIAGRGGYNPGEPRWSLATSLEARRGLDFLGASDDCGPGGTACFLPGAVPLTRIEGKPDAFLVRANALAEWRPARQFPLSAAPRAP